MNLSSVSCKVATRWENFNEGWRDAADRLVLTNHEVIHRTLVPSAYSLAPIPNPSVCLQVKGFSSP